MASYRFSHSIDISSTDAINYVTTPDAVSNPNIDRGDSDFGIRHSFTAGVTYDLPAPGSDKVAQAYSHPITSIATEESGDELWVGIRNHGSFDRIP